MLSAPCCMDVLCFPSHYDAPGRPIFEAAFFGVPSIVAVRNPRPDTLVDGETGLAIRPHDADELAEAITRLATHRADAAEWAQQPNGWRGATSTPIAMRRCC